MRKRWLQIIKERMAEAHYSIAAFGNCPDCQHAAHSGVCMAILGFYINAPRLRCFESVFFCPCGGDPELLARGVLGGKPDGLTQPKNAF